MFALRYLVVPDSISIVLSTNSPIDPITKMFKNEFDAGCGVKRNLQTPQLVLLPAQTEEQKRAHFIADLDSAVRSLEEASEKSAETRKKMEVLSSALQNRDWWDTFKGNFNGQTDKDLAQNVHDLGWNLETTQKVIRVMLQVQTHKGHLLQSFSEALVKKIILLQADTQTLDGNQRAAALAFLEELHQQVQEHIRQQDLIEQHEQQLQELSQWQFEKISQDSALEQQLDDIAQSQKLTSQQFGQLIESIATLQGGHVRLTDQMQTSRRNLDVLQAQMVKFERRQIEEKSLTSILLRHGLSLLALGVAVAALIRSLDV
jgi:hypothetical protein